MIPSVFVHSVGKNKLHKVSFFMLAGRKNDELIYKLSKNLEREGRRIKCKLQILWALLLLLLPVYWRSTWKLLWSCCFYEKELNMFLWFFFESFREKIMRIELSLHQLDDGTLLPAQVALENLETFRFFNSVMFSCKSFNNRAKTLCVSHPLITKLSKSQP